MTSIDARILSGVGLQAAEYSLPSTFGRRPTRDFSFISAENGFAVLASDLPGYQPTAAQAVELFVSRLGSMPTTIDPDKGMTEMTGVFDDGNMLAASHKGRLSVAAVKIVHGNKGREAIVGNAGVNTVEIVEGEDINHTSVDLGVRQDPSIGQFAACDIFRYGVYPGDNFYLLSPVVAQNVTLPDRQAFYSTRDSDSGSSIADLANKRALDPTDNAGRWAAGRGDVTVINLKVLENT